MAENTARRLAQKGPDYAQDAVEQSKTAATETATAMQDTYRAASKGAVHFNLQLLETAQNNVNAAFGFARQLMQLQSPSEFFEVSAAHARKQWEVLTEQTRHLAAAAQKVTSEAAQPLQDGMVKAFDPRIVNNT